MRRLIVMRHAKSSWSSPAARDIDRALNARGVASAKALGAWLRESGFAPEHVLCSSARRTAETWETLDLPGEARFVSALYHASAATILREVRAGEGESLLVLGHNPGIAAFADMILREAPGHERFEDYPTGATLIATFKGEWQDLSPGMAQADAFIVPRDLLG
ncbi:MAG: histidine phosphatase family protein [Pseudomonadota bacterium]